MGQEEVRHVRARDHEQERNGSEKRQQRAPQALHGGFAQRYILSHDSVK
jgi:hypothetical protein